MRKGLIVFILSLIFALQANSYELILPADKKSIVNSDYAFFVGKALGSESVTINDEGVYIAPNGAFAHSVKLKDGENRIMVRSNYCTKIYKVYKNTVLNKEFPIEEFDTKRALVNFDNTPLRKTPVDAGLNRIGHLFAGTHLLLDGSKGDFYRVFLSKNKTAWIAKKDVTFDDSEITEPAKFLNMNTKSFKNASVQTISFTKKLPYTVEDTDKEIIFRVYNPVYSAESVYNLNIPKQEKYMYSVMLNDNGEYTFKVRQLPDNIKDCTIVIDAGHGGEELGAIGCLGDEEKTINLKIAQELASILSNAGANVVMTRECDCNLSLNDRVNIAKENGADIFVSVHLNSIGNVKMNVHKNRGTSVFYFNKNSEMLAKSIERSLSSQIGTRKDGVKGASFAVIRPSEYVAVLVEAAYMTNPLDSVLYTKPTFAKEAAAGIAKGIINYISKK